MTGRLFQLNGPNARWSMDFMHDRLDLGRPFCLLNIVDDFTAEVLAIRAAFSLRSSDVIRAIEDIALECVYPEVIRSDNGSQFCSHKMLRWAFDRDIQLPFIQPGKPTQNANVASLNGRVSRRAS